MQSKVAQMQYSLYYTKPLNKYVEGRLESCSFNILKQVCGVGGEVENCS